MAAFGLRFSDRHEIILQTRCRIHGNNWVTFYAEGVSIAMAIEKPRLHMRKVNLQNIRSREKQGIQGTRNKRASLE